MTRNPLRDPLPGDWIEKGDGRARVRVDHVAHGWVYYMRFRGSRRGDPCRIRLAVYRKQCADFGAVVLRRAEEQP